MAWKKKIVDHLECYTLQSHGQYHELYRGCHEDINKSDDKLEFYHGNHNYIWESLESNDDLPNGVYNLKGSEYSDFMYLASVKLPETESILDLKINKPILDDLELFYQSRDLYTKLKVTYKLGILLYGPPGTGKTSTIQRLIQEYTPKDSLCITCNNMPNLGILKELQKDPRLKIIVFEELTNLLKGNGEAGESLLTFLDGANSLDNCIVIATTNYPERLPPNIADRPGRFDRFYEIGMLGLVDIKKYLHHFKIKFSEQEAVDLLGLTIAEIKSIAIMLLRDKFTISEGLAKIKEHKDKLAKEFTKRKTMGFNNDE